MCDEATVLRNGVTVAQPRSLTGVDRADLAEMMVGEAAAQIQRPTDQPSGDVVLDLEGVSAMSDRGCRRCIRSTSTYGQARSWRGRRVGQRAAGAGRSHRRSAPHHGGAMRLAGTDVTGTSPRARSRAGLAYVPEDRLGVGLAPTMSVVDNAVVRSYRSMRRR